MAPLSVEPFGPFGFDDVANLEAGTDGFADAVPDRSVVLDIGRDAFVVDLDVRRAVEVGERRGETTRSGIVGEDPPDRVIDREHPQSARPQHSRDLGHDLCGIRDERNRPEGRTCEVEALVRERQRLGAGLDEGNPPTGLVHRRHAAGQHSHRQIEADDVGALRCEPSRARRRTAADLEDALTCDVTEEMHIALVQPLGAPHELAGARLDAQELAVGAVVVVGIGVPPRATGPFARGRTDPGAGNPAGSERGDGGGMTIVGHGDQA